MRHTMCMFSAWESLGIYICVISHSLLCTCHCVRQVVIWYWVFVSASVCTCVGVSVSLCPCVAVSVSALVLPPLTAAEPARDSPAPPSLLSFIIICHEREPRRTVINKGHLKYKTTTLTLGNISSVEQLVPPLSLWKGTPGAASPCLASSDSPAPTLPAWDLEASGGLGRGAHQSPLQAGLGWPSVCLSRVLCGRWVIMGKG